MASIWTDLPALEKIGYRFAFYELLQSTLALENNLCYGAC